MSPGPNRARLANKPALPPFRPYLNLGNMSD